MLDDVKSDADERMSKSLVALDAAFARIRTGRAHPKLLDGINVDYYGTPTPLESGGEHYRRRCQNPRRIAMGETHDPGC